MDLNNIRSRAKRAWNVFFNKDPTFGNRSSFGGYSYRPDRVMLTRGNEQSIVTAVYNRIASDVSAITIKHVRTDSSGRYLSTIDSGLNKCLNLEANIDQTGRAFMLDAVMSMLDEGCVALFPIEIDEDSKNLEDIYANGILSMRTAKIVEWFPDHVRLRAYNELNGQKEERIVPKNFVAIIENPFYAVMNEPNSTMQRLIRKINLLDVIDEQSSSGKLDLIIQLPYDVKSSTKDELAKRRIQSIEDQLIHSKYGIAYTGVTEHVIQLNRAVENNLMSQIEYLTNMLFSQLGITQALLDGTADETTMINYNNRIVEPIVAAIVDEMSRKFISKTARTQRQTIMFFVNPFKLVPVSQLAEAADKLTRNEIMTSNEMRQIIGLPPSSDPRADELRNKNLNKSNDEKSSDVPVFNTDNTGNLAQPITQSDYEAALASLDEIDNDLDDLEHDINGEVTHYAGEYYDPVKAHEYYEQHKKLKGRKSTSGLNDEGREAAKYVKDSLDAERKKIVEAHKTLTDSKVQNNSDSISSDRGQMKKQIEAYKTQMKSEISSLQTYLKNLNSGEKKAQKEAIQHKISLLRENNSEKREQLKAAFSSESTRLREQNTALKKEHQAVRASLKTKYDQKYEDELEKIRSDSSFTKK